jgi:hypothetical protein
LAHQLHYPFIFELKEKLTYKEFQIWFDYFNISNSDNVSEALDEYFYDGVDDLGKQALKALRNLQGKK